MINQVPFIGRSYELAEIQKAFEDFGTRRLIYFVGDGGVGKTRLLEEAKSTIESNPNFFVIPSLDFDDPTITNFDNFEFRLASEINNKGIKSDSYFNALNDLRKMQGAKVSIEGIINQQKIINKILVDLLNNSTHEKRIALFIDTSEKAESMGFWENFLSLLSTLNNVVCIIVGRPHKEFNLSVIIDHGFEGQVQEFNLKPLDINDSQKYLEAKQEQIHTNIDPATVNKLLLLADGRPILLDLAVELVARGTALDTLEWLYNTDSSAFDAASDDKKLEMRKNFEEHLVLYISKIRKRVHQLILILSRIYPLSREMVSFLVQLPAEEANSLFDEMKSFVFVKSFPDPDYISLHDEMRRLVIEYVWHEVDPDGLRQKRDSRRAVEWYQRERGQLLGRLQERKGAQQPDEFDIEKLQEYLDTLEEQLCLHLLESDIPDRFSTWMQVVNQQRLIDKFSSAKKLVDNAFTHFPTFTEDQQFDYLLLKARLTGENGQGVDAEIQLNSLLEQFGQLERRKSSISNALGIVEGKLGKFELALTHQLQCLEIIQHNNPKAVPNVANRVGYNYRLLGNKADAEKYYRLALEAIAKFPENERDENLRASLHNNLGYIFGLNRKFLQMESQCDKATDIWSKVGLEKEIGRTEATRAIFYRDQGFYQRASELLNQAILRYELPDDHEQLCRAYFHLGWTQWYIAEKIDEQLSDISLVEWDEPALSKALEYLEKSLELARMFGLKYELPGILHQTASAHWYLGRTKKDDTLMQEAKELNDEAFKTSLSVRDIRYAIDSLVGYAEWDYDLGQYQNIPSVDQQLHSEFGQYEKQYELYFGRMHRIKADIAFQQQNWEQAFSNYAKGLALIVDHHGFGRFTPERELLRLTGKLKQLNTDLVKDWVAYLQNEWSKLEGKQRVDLLLDWCSQYDIPGFSE